MSAEEAARRDGPRIGDAERNAAIDELRRQTGEGRLELDEFADRVELVLDARRQSEIDEVMRDLPVQRVETVDSGTAKTVFGVLSGARQRGMWQVPDKVTAFALWGSVQLDFRAALLRSPVVRVDAVAIMGSVDIILPPGIPVEVDGGVVMGGLDDKRRSEEPIPGAPVIHIVVSGLWGGVTIRSKKSKGGSGAIDVSGVPASAPQVVPPTPAAPPTPPSPPTPPEPAHSLPSVGVPGSDAPSHGTVAILVTDIVSSTQWAEELGDQRWLEVLRTHNALVRSTIAEFGGTEIKQNGDGFLATFSSVASAVEAGLVVRDGVIAGATSAGGVVLSVRVGVHAGEVARDDGDVFGVNVSTADRVCAAADPDEVLVSGVVADLADSATAIEFDDPRELEITGRSRPVRVHAARSRR